MAREPELETAIMQILWGATRPLSPAEVREDLGRDLAYTTVMTVLVRLWKKGLLSREKLGKANVYTAAADRESVVAANMMDLVDRARGAGPVLARFTDRLDETERQYLIRLLEES